MREARVLVPTENRENMVHLKRTQTIRRRISVLAAGVLAVGTCAAQTGCYGRGAGLFAAVATTAILTAAVVSASQPPPPRVVYVPEPHPGYVWDPGHWTIVDGEWVWVEGRWIAVQPGYAWAPTHWVQRADGTWELVPGHWVAAPPPPDRPAPPPPPPPPPPA